MTEYTVELQKLFVDMLMSEPEVFIRCRNIIDPENFDRSLRGGVEFINDYVDKHRSLPDAKQIKAVSKLEIETIDMDSDKIDWFMDEFEIFSRHKACERAILECADLLEKGESGPLEKIMKDAVSIGLTRDLGTSYFEDPRARLMKIKENNSITSTGWASLDKKLYGGFERGTLNIFAGGSGSGKSLFLQNLGLNWALAGMNGLYISLELSEELTSMRIDAMVTNIPTREIFKNLDTVELKVKMVGKKAGIFDLKYMQAQSNTTDIRSFIKEWEIQKGIKCDFVLVDYLDLVMPISVKVNPSDMFIKDKFVCEELRNLSKEFNLLMATASQLNRGSVEEIEFDHSHIAGGISKINTADTVIGIFTSRALKERDRIQIQLMKTRSSNGVGSKIDLGLDGDSMRIIDLGIDGEDPDSSHVSHITDKLKKKSVVMPGTEHNNNKEDEDNNPIKKQHADGAKLRLLLSHVNDDEN